LIVEEVYPDGVFQFWLCADCGKFMVKEVFARHRRTTDHKAIKVKVIPNVVLDYINKRLAETGEAFPKRLPLSVACSRCGRKSLWEIMDRDGRKRILCVVCDKKNIDSV